MNAEALLKHYEQIADAPDAVGRLRRFILDLAVRGKLVPQDSADEPAGDLLKRIASEKVRRIKVGDFREPKAQPLPEEPAYELPASWRWSRIAEIGFISPRVDAIDDLLASFVPMTLIAAEVGVRHQHEPRKWGDIKKGYTHFADGDVGLAKITPCFENGKSAVFRNLTGGVGSGTTELHVVRPVLADPEYVLLFLKSPQFIETGIPRMTGTAGQKRVPTEYFAHSPLPLPPLAEQHRIVAKVDELMALCDQLEAARAKREAKRDRLATASLARLNTPDPETFQADARFAIGTALPALTTRPDQIKQLRQTILNLAVRGRLVEQQHSDAPARADLESIAAERSELVRNKVIRNEELPTLVSSAELPFDVPSNWSWARVGHIFLFSQYGTSQKSYPSSDGVPVLAMGNIQDGKVVWHDEKRIPATSEDLPALLLKKFDLLYNRTNSAELVGKTGIYLGLDDALTFASYLIRLRPSIGSSSPRYLNLTMNAPYFRSTQIAPLIKKQTGQANVNGTALKNMLIPLPPLAEQQRIVAKVDELISLCDQLEASLTCGESTRSRLLNALMHEALAPVKRELEAA